MTKLCLFILGVTVVLSQERVPVQDLTGTWQGVLRENGRDQRTVIKILVFVYRITPCLRMPEMADR